MRLLCLVRNCLHSDLLSYYCYDRLLEINVGMYLNYHVFHNLSVAYIKKLMSMSYMRTVGVHYSANKRFSIIVVNYFMSFISVCILSLINVHFWQRDIYMRNMVVTTVYIIIIINTLYHNTTSW